MLKLRQSNGAIYNFAIQRFKGGFSGSATLKFSINAPLRARALADIKEKYPTVDSDVIAPTNLILFNNADLVIHGSGFDSVSIIIMFTVYEACDNETMCYVFSPQLHGYTYYA